MESFRIEWKNSATKDLRAIPKAIVVRVVQVVAELAVNPFPAGAKKLVGSQHTYRIRIGDYRVVYNVLAERVIVEVIRVRHRKDVYR